jgi:hypothetical protein
MYVIVLHKNEDLQTWVAFKKIPLQKRQKFLTHNIRAVSRGAFITLLVNYGLGGFNASLT